VALQDVVCAVDAHISSSFPRGRHRHSRAAVIVIPAQPSSSFPRNRHRHSRAAVIVIPAQAGIQNWQLGIAAKRTSATSRLDPRLRGDDGSALVIGMTAVRSLPV
jgi:hypothetical protein